MKKTLARRFKARMGMAGAIASVMLFAVPALAQDESRLSLADRVARLEQQLQSQDQGGIGMVNQVQQLQSQLQQLQGQIEELQHQVQELQDKNKAQYADLDARLSKLESAGTATTGSSAPTAVSTGQDGTVPTSAAQPAPAPASTAAPTAPAAANGADASGAQPAYDAAFTALRNAKYVEASRGFRAFIQQYPNHALTPNAYYWLGESYYVTTNYQVALETFQKLLNLFPQSDKAPDALLKVGYSQIELKQVDAAKVTLGAVASKYPGSKAAGLAQERLRRLQSQPAG